MPILALIALSLATLPLAVSLAHRVDRGQQHMRRLLVNAVESSDLERRRVAQDLHDGVVQDLAGIGYSLESEAQHSRVEPRCGSTWSTSATSCAATSPPCAP